MKIRAGYELRQVGDEYVVITVGDAMNSFNGMIRLNKTGEFVWSKLKQGSDIETLIDHFAAEFGIDRAIADIDVKAFIETIRQTNCLED